MGKKDEGWGHAGTGFPGRGDGKSVRTPSSGNSFVGLAVAIMAGPLAVLIGVVGYLAYHGIA